MTAALDDPIERMLTASAPSTTPVTADVEDELARMSVRARTDHAPVRRLAPRVAAIAVVGALALGGAGAAAAATGGWSAWWAEKPDGVVSYTLPSGAQCEYRFGGMMIGTAHEPIRDFAREWYASADLDRIVSDGVQANIQAQRADRDRWFVNDDGTREPAWYGTDRYATPDAEYDRAAQMSISHAFDAALRASDLDLEAASEGRGLSIEGEGNCPGAQW